MVALESEPGNPASDHYTAVVVPDFDILKERKIVNAKEVIRFDIEGISAKFRPPNESAATKSGKTPCPGPQLANSNDSSWRSECAPTRKKGNRIPK